MRRVPFNVYSISSHAAEVISSPAEAHEKVSERWKGDC